MHLEVHSYEPVHSAGSGSAHEKLHSSQSFFAASPQESPPPHFASASSSMSQPSQANVFPLRHSASRSTQPSQSEYSSSQPYSSALVVVPSMSATQSSYCASLQPSQLHLRSQIALGETPQPPPRPRKAKSDESPIHAPIRGARPQKPFFVFIVDAPLKDQSQTRCSSPSSIQSWSRR